MKFTHILMKLDDGRWTTIHKNEIEKFKKLGHTFGPESRGAATRHIKEALAIEKYGKSYIIGGKYDGKVAMYFAENKGTAAVEQEQVAGALKTGYVLGDPKNISK